MCMTWKLIESIYNYDFTLKRLQLPAEIRPLPHEFAHHCRS